MPSHRKNVVRIEEPKGVGSNFMPSGSMVAPGNYTATLSKQFDGEITDLSKSIEVKVERLYEGSLQGASPEVVAAFWKELEEFSADVMMTSLELQNATKKVKAMQRAIAMAESSPGDLDKSIRQLEEKIFDLDEQLNGNRSKQEVGEVDNANVMQRLMVPSMGTTFSTYGPTPLHKESFEIAKSQHKAIRENVNKIIREDIPKLIDELDKAGAPHIEGFMRD